MQPLAIAILAAGASRRLGRAKQLLCWRGKSLVQHALDTAADTGQKPIFLVVGANQADVVGAVQAEDLTIVPNALWQEGLASSIRSAVEQAQGRAQALMLLNCDQPQITASALKEMIARFDAAERPLVAAQYNGVVGSPAIFGRIFFGQLLALKGDTGARSILREHEELLTRVDMPAASLDIDTEDDWLTINQLDLP